MLAARIELGGYDPRSSYATAVVASKVRVISRIRAGLIVEIRVRVRIVVRNLSLGSWSELELQHILILITGLVRVRVQRDAC